MSEPAAALPNVRRLAAVRPEPRAATGEATTIVALPVSVDLALYKGDDFEMTVTVTDAAGAPVDLTGSVPLAQIRTSPFSDPPVTLFLASVDAVETSVIWLVLPHAAASLLPGRTVYDLQLTDPAGRVATLIAGTITTVAEVSR
jgi:hypothetical protein